MTERLNTPPQAEVSEEKEVTTAPVNGDTSTSLNSAPTLTPRQMKMTRMISTTEREFEPKDASTYQVNLIADQLAMALSGEYNVIVSADSDDVNIQKLVIMINFLLVTIQDRIEKKEKVELERLIRELQDALLFKDQFMATMSHELRTPLNAILGYSGIALMKDLAPNAEHFLQRIEENAKRLLNLINDILDISRINAGRTEIVSEKIKLRALVEGWYDDFKPRMDEKGLQFKLVYDSTLPEEITNDADRLTQITTNLLNNAYKFTDMGLITLEVKSNPNNAQEMVINVSDTGSGIPESWQHLIFEEFRQVDGTSSRKYGGAGLGLSIVQKLCILMGGQVRVQSKLNEGSIFSVTLPFTTEKVSTEADIAP